MPQVNGSLIRSRRQRLGIKLGEFAKRAGVNYKTLANIESGLRDGSPYTASIEVIHRIADALGADADDLLVKPQQGAAALWHQPCATRSSLAAPASWSSRRSTPS